MKNRSQPFDCSIAGKTVGISLRHGGGLQEPAHVYVRCEERDCQYVDLNEAPCPLRVEMFEDGSDVRVIDHLSGQRGLRHCFECLTEILGITHDQVRRASWRLKDVEGFSIRPSRCVRCQRRRVTIGLAGRAPARVPSSPPLESEPAGAQRTVSSQFGAAVRALEPHLRNRAGFAFCAHCLARELTLTVDAVRDAMRSLEPDEAFQIRGAQCVSCLLTKRVVRFQGTARDTDHARHVIGFLVESKGAAFCTACVAFAAEVSLPDARRVLGGLKSVPQFSHEPATCQACGRWEPAVLYVGSDIADADRAADVGEMLTGHLRYRGFRIDLLSFRTGQGWRPFALVKAGGGGAAGPSMIFLDLVATKVEADDVAARLAREWIDKRYA